MTQLAGLSTVPTTVNYFPAKEEQGGLGPLLVFIPGNPGVIEFYSEYFEALGDQWPALEILGISQAGHDIPPGSNTPFHKVFTLEDQIDHKVQIIENFLSNNKASDRKLSDAGTFDRDVLIMGHSVGSYMMERIVARLLDKVNFKFIGFLTPTIIDIHKSAKGIKLYPIVKVFPFFNSLVSAFSHILSWVPETIKSFLLSQILNNPNSHALNATSSFISRPEQIKQSLGLATEEMHAIQNDWEYFNGFLTQTKAIPKWFFFSNVDHWVHKKTQCEITERLVSETNIKVENSDHIVHSFCVKQSEEFAKITIGALKELYKS